MCSSVLIGVGGQALLDVVVGDRLSQQGDAGRLIAGAGYVRGQLFGGQPGDGRCDQVVTRQAVGGEIDRRTIRSEERRLGTDCSSRMSPQPPK